MPPSLGEILLVLGIVSLSLLLGILVFLKNSKGKMNRYFSMVCFFLSFFIASAFISEFFPLTRPDLSLLFTRFTYIGVVVWGLFFFLFSFYFPKKRKLFPKLFIFSSLLAIVFSGFIAFSDFIIKGIELREESFDVLMGDFSTLLFLYFGLLFSFIVYNFSLSYKESVGYERQRMKFFFLGVGIFIIFIIFTNFVLSFILGTDKYYRFGNYSSIIFLLFTAYAILRHRLMDIRVATGKILIYLFTLTFISFLSYGLFLLFFYFDLSPEIKVILSALICALLFNPIRSFFQYLASRYFYYDYHLSREAFSKLSKEMTENLNLRKLTDLITSKLISSLKVNRAVILLRNKKTGKFNIVKNIGFKEENGISLVEDNFLTEWLRKNKRPLVYEELSLMLREGRGDREKVTRLQENMRRIEAELCLPLIFKDKITGIIVLGEKKSRDPYSLEDIDLLSGLFSQFSVSIENARLFTEVEDLSENLEKKVEEQTRELKRAFKELQASDLAKSEFIAMASHQLRTPLASIKGYLSMIKEERYGEITLETREKIGDILSSTERLINIVNTLLNISKTDLGKIDLELEKVDLNKIAKQSFNIMRKEGEDKGLEMIFSPFKEEIEAPVDKNKIDEVISALIDNAIKYTKEGKVEVFLEREGDFGVISVKDTGEGISKEEEENIFKGFTRGSAGKTHFVEGAGLGLHLSQRYLNLHKGKLIAKSQGKGKGSTFKAYLPLYEKVD